MHIADFYDRVTLRNRGGGITLTASTIFFFPHWCMVKKILLLSQIFELKVAIDLYRLKSHEFENHISAAGLLSYDDSRHAHKSIANVILWFREPQNV